MVILAAVPDKIMEWLIQDFINEEVKTININELVVVVL